MALSKRTRFLVLMRDNYTCQYCGARPPDTVLEIDHVIPRSKGGRDDIGNLKTACWNCNRGKSALSLPRIWTFTDGVHGVLGPRHGETVSRTEQFPAYWVYRADEDFEFYEDELDADVYFSVWEQRLKWGHPHRRTMHPGQEEVGQRWDHGYAGDRPLHGFYLPLVTHMPAQQWLAWFPLEEAIGWALTISTQPEPDDVV